MVDKNNTDTDTDTDQSHKSHNAPVPCPTVRHSEQKCAHFCSEWCIAVFVKLVYWLDITATCIQVWMLLLLKPPAIRLFVNHLIKAHKKIASKLDITGPCDGFPSQMASKEEIVSMSWCHHRQRQSSNVDMNIPGTPSLAVCMLSVLVRSDYEKCSLLTCRRLPSNAWRSSIIYALPGGIMKSTGHGNIISIAGPLWRETTGHGWIHCIAIKYF